MTSLDISFKDYGDVKMTAAMEQFVDEADGVRDGKTSQAIWSQVDDTLRAFNEQAKRDGKIKFWQAKLFAAIKSKTAKVVYDKTMKQLDESFGTADLAYDKIAKQISNQPKEKYEGCRANLEKWYETQTICREKYDDIAAAIANGSFENMDEIDQSMKDLEGEVQALLQEIQKIGEDVESSMSGDEETEKQAAQGSDESTLPQDATQTTPGGGETQTAKFGL